MHARVRAQTHAHTLTHASTHARTHARAHTHSRSRKTEDNIQKHGKMLFSELDSEKACFKLGFESLGCAHA